MVTYIEHNDHQGTHRTANVFYNLKTHTKHQRENSAFTFINNAEYMYT